MSLVNADQYEPFRPECIIAEKVYNECQICECPSFVLANVQPEPASVESCEVAPCPPETEAVRIVEADVPEPDRVRVVIEFDLLVRYRDLLGNLQEVCRTFTFARTVALPGALPGMVVRVVPVVQCLGCNVMPTDTTVNIVCDVGIAILIKVTALVQLLLEAARFCPEPPECEEVFPFGCPEFLEACLAGEFFQFPPQPEPVDLVSARRR